MTVVTLRPSTGPAARPAAGTARVIRFPDRPGARTARETGSPARTPASPAARPVRLTRRGRRVVGALAVIAAALAAVLLSLALSGGALAANHGSAGSGYQGMRQVVVEPGQDLWALAERAEPGADPRLVIPRIVSANALAGSTIFPGEQLWVPR
jgi:hypothetical protein